MILRRWIAGVIDYARESWAELRLEEQRAKEAEFNRLHPMHGPPTSQQAMIQALWGGEILRQMQPVLRFAQRVCGFCNATAVWRWKPKNPPVEYNQFMCDDHAAKIDLDDLEKI